MRRFSQPLPPRGVIRALALSAVACIVSIIVSCSSPTAPTPPRNQTPQQPNPNQPPVLTIACPANITVTATSDAGMAVNFEFATPSGGVAPVLVTCTRQSGSLFPIGSTAVQCTARDNATQTASCGFTVTVNPRIARLSLTKFLAFGDSVTLGEVTAPLTTSRAGGTNYRNVVVPSAAYPTRLLALLRARYVPQAMAIEMNNAGLPGEFAEDAVLRLRGVLSSYRPSVLLLLHGHNDLYAGVPIATIANQLDLMAKEGRNRGARVFIATLPPPRPGGPRTIPASLVSALNDRIRVIAVGEGAVLVDLYAALVSDIPRFIGTDGLHPTEAGYQRIAELFFDAIRADLEVR